MVDFHDAVLMSAVNYCLPSCDDPHTVTLKRNIL